MAARHKYCEKCWRCFYCDRIHTERDGWCYACRREKVLNHVHKVLSDYAKNRTSKGQPARDILPSFLEFVDH